MKKLLNVAAILIFCIYFMGFGVRALAEEDAEYRIFFENDEYLLCYTDEGNCDPIFAAKSLSAVLERIYALSPRAVIIFSDISSAESIYLKSGEYEIRGEIEFVDGAGMTVDGAKIRICSADVTMNTASIRIKRGSVEMHSGCIRSSAQNAILLDYSSGAALSVFGGKIITSSDNSSIFVKHGTLTVSGGSIENFSGVAIYAQSTVVLSGAPRISGDDYGIDTGVPLTLSDGVSDFSGSVSVRFSEEFERGSISCIAYMATEASLSGIQLFDIKGSLKELKYFSSYKGIDETDFGAVYSPYTVEFKDNGRVIYSEYLLHG